MYLISHDFLACFCLFPGSELCAEPVFLHFTPTPSGNHSKIEEAPMPVMNLQRISGYMFLGNNDENETSDPLVGSLRSNEITAIAICQLGG
jgi:hypothetical protein